MAGQFAYRNCEWKIRIGLPKCMLLFRKGLFGGRCRPTLKKVLKDVSNLRNMIALVAFRNDRIVGNAQICKYPHLRRKGTGDALIYLHQDFHNVGLGTLMFKELLNLAEVEGTHRVSLHVVAENSAIHLYENNGSRVEGVMKDAYFGEDGKYHDELVMGLVLASSTSPS